VTNEKDYGNIILIGDVLKFPGSSGEQGCDTNQREVCYYYPLAILVILLTKYPVAFFLWSRRHLAINDSTFVNYSADTYNYGIPNDC